MEWTHACHAQQHIARDVYEGAPDLVVCEHCGALGKFSEHSSTSAAERLERIATAVLAGFASVANDAWHPPDAALHAVRWAAALIEELDREEPPAKP